MENVEDGQRQSKERIIQVFSDFMTRIEKFEQLVSIGSRFLVGFQQALAFIGRPPIDTKSALVEQIMKSSWNKKAYILC